MNTIRKIALYQGAVSQHPQENLQCYASVCAQAQAQDINILVFPELQNGPYFCQEPGLDAFTQAESIPGPSTEYFSALAAKHQLVIVATLFEKRMPGVFHNTAIVLDTDGTLAGQYRKMHIPDDPGYGEKYYFTPGDQGFAPINTSCGRLGVMICWDQWFPEAARLMALAGADILLYPTAIGWDNTDNEAEKARQLDAWITVQRAHAVANHLPVVACNRIGFESTAKNDMPGIDFWGNSFITGAQGEILASASATDTTLLSASIDTEHTKTVRQSWPFFRDRRIDHYGDLNRLAFKNS